MKTDKSRFRREGKNPYERAAYRNFLSAKFHLDKTVEDNDRTLRSDDSSVDVEQPSDSKTSVTPKSFRLKVGDFFNNNWVISIISGLIFLVLGIILAGYIDIKSDNSGIKVSLQDLEKKTTDISQKNEGQDNELSRIDKEQSNSKIELSKDILYLKDALQHLLK